MSDQVIFSWREVGGLCEYWVGRGRTCECSRTRGQGGGYEERGAGRTSEGRQVREEAGGQGAWAGEGRAGG